jgi:tellurite resistance protein TerC
VVGVLFADDLARSWRRPQALPIRSAVLWSAWYVALALVFFLVLGLVGGWDAGGQYLAGFVVEKSLSVDNLFVFAIVLARFAVPAPLQSRALSVGVALALALRTVFILIGAALINSFSVMFLLFGVLLLVTAVQLLRHRNEDPDISENLLLRTARRLLPVTPRYHGGRLVVRSAGRRAITPMLLVLLALASADLLFAFDSIPAVFGVTDSAYIVFCANAFALLGLRPLYFLVLGFLDRMIYLSTGLAAVLALIGVKLVLEFAHGRNDSVPEISTAASMAAIVLILAVTAVASARAARRDPSRRAHAGALSSRPREPEQREG